MKILFDENISYRTVRELKKNWSKCRSVRELNLTNTSDSLIWEYASKNHYILASLDEDFVNLAMLSDSLTKLILIKSGNCSHIQMTNLFLKNKLEIEKFCNSNKLKIFLLFP